MVAFFSCAWSVHETEIFWQGKREETFARPSLTKAVPAKENNLTCERPRWQNLIIKIMAWKWRRGHGWLKTKLLEKAASLFIFLQGLCSWTISTNYILFNVHWEVSIFKGGIQRANHMIGVVFSSTPNDIPPWQAFLTRACMCWLSKIGSTLFREMVESWAFSDREFLWKGNLPFHNSNLVKHNWKFVDIICDSFGKIE